jgi:hypothetical protein
MPAEVKAFVAYPSSPKLVSESIREACSEFRKHRASWELIPWEVNDVAGYCLTDPILEKIGDATFVIADITGVNFNVVYEVAYAIGRRKRVFLIRNRTVETDEKLLRDVGIFDTLGYVEYSNSDELISRLKKIENFDALPLSDAPLNKRVPVYIVTPREKAEAEIRIISRVKKAGGIFFRSFDPVESARLSARSAIDNVLPSIGIILPLLASNRSDSAAHNLRCAFVAGLAHSLEKQTLLLQAAGSDPIPIDLRDYVSTYDTLDSINRYIAEFVPEVTRRIQEEEEFVLSESATPLTDLVIGQSAAENEMSQLASYYLQTEEFNRVISGGTNVVAARKGAGKSALFFHTRNQLRREKQLIVLDLNPEGFQLQKFKNLVLKHLQKGTAEHTITAFWEYLFLLEICHKLIQKDRNTYMHNHLIREHYLNVVELYESDPFLAEGDFAERMLKLTESVEDAFQAAIKEAGEEFLTRSQITELLYRHDFKKLRETSTKYLELKKGVWVLFDNVDKGWHAHGIDAVDLLILKCLIEALTKLRRELEKEGIPCRTVVFIRNDVYELLVDSMSDRGKISKIALDWTDPQLLRELLRRRFVSNLRDKSVDFETIWRSIAQTHVFGGTESSTYVIERCLMRPRALLDFLSHSKAHAVNLRHSKILEEDFALGEQSYSTDLINQIDLEIQDVYPEAQESLYAFIEAPSLLDKSQLMHYLARLGLTAEKSEKLIELLLWYGFLGIFRHDGTMTYIYNVNYEMRKLVSLRDQRGEADLVYCINPAFWAGLDIKRN